MGRILTRGGAGVALLLACTPTEPCACPPARTSLLVYGEVHTVSGTPAAAAVVRYLLATVDGLLVPFRWSRPDSIGIMLTLR